MIAIIIVMMMMMMMMMVMMIMMIGSMNSQNTIDALPFPNDFDSFLEMLFEHVECEDFLSDNKWSAVALRDCKPYVCNFPREICRRPAAKYQDVTSNRCSRIPENCLIAANGGIALTTDTNTFTDNRITNSNIEELELTTVASSLSKIATKSIDNLVEICNLDQPRGRYCGFTIKVAYNKYNQRCEEFWFPGCRTVETNQNLFDTVAECMKKTDICRGTGTFVPFFTTRHPLMPASIEPPSPPVPLVEPFLATTTIPQAKIVDINTSVKSRVAPTARPPRLLPWISGEVVNPHVSVVDPQSSLKPSQLTVQPYWMTSPSGAKMILSLISNSISQLTGGGLGNTEDSGGFLYQIPQFLRLLQRG
uniref:Bm3764, isoform c n=1 Tax=Brugia malayi TaxID=6279 RepID=A0A1I9G7M9_BRUMA|nr:Bm3764, isoform c [Brugia malayi]